MQCKNIRHRWRICSSYCASWSITRSWRGFRALRMRRSSWARRCSRRRRNLPAECSRRSIAVGDREGVRWSDTQVATAAGWKQAYGQFVEGGWNALACPREFGGQNLPRALSALVEEMWNGANMAFTLCPMLTRGAIEAIDLKRIGAPEGDVSAENGLRRMDRHDESHRAAGGIGSRGGAHACAEPSGGGRYKLEGQKIFITYGEHDLTENIIHMVLARTPGRARGRQGHVAVRGAEVPGECRRLARRAQRRALPVGRAQARHSRESHLRARLRAARRRYRASSSGEENRGLEYMFIMMNAARFAVGLEGIGLVGAGVSDARSRSRTNASRAWSPA